MIAPSPTETTGVVIIGRNEGERLIACLNSVTHTISRVVYVDSGSTDGSVQAALERSADVVSLNMSTPFTAARARNEGWRRLRDLFPNLRYVQFVDGDCEVEGAWLDAAHAHLEQHPDLAVVCGRRREKYPERSVYNRLCNIEWDTPIGEAKACGGDAMMRIEALTQVGGFKDNLIAGEEPELCVRLRQTGWRIERLDREMTQHDAAITRFSQWWQRSKRAGYAFSAGAHLHGAPPERHWVAETRRAVLWGLGVPLTTLALSLCVSPWFLALILIYPIQWLRLTLRSRDAAYALFTVLGKFPEAAGVLQFERSRWTRRTDRLIEYK
jgi:glycosyltransferase involved in cell wall biosynthesis